ncbi:hypothetical protein DYB36_011823, partial [Aphanomyces astaci]
MMQCEPLFQDSAIVLSGYTDRHVVMPRQSSPTPLLVYMSRVRSFFACDVLFHQEFRIPLGQFPSE